MKPVLSVVVPLYNEESLIATLVERIDISCKALGMVYEIVIVNDGSRDKTLPRLIEQSRTCPALRVVNLFRNFGHMAALSAGIASATGDAVLVMDGDLQDPPELIPEFVRQWRDGADVVYGLRTARHESFLKKTLTAGFYKLLRQGTDVEIPSQVGTFGLMDRKVVAVICSMPERARFFCGLTGLGGGETGLCPI